MGKYLF